MASIHGHEVMRMMLESKEAFTDASLVRAIRKRFGEDARFHTCSAQDLTAEELVEFLRSRGKFHNAGAGFQTSRDNICDHS